MNFVGTVTTGGTAATHNVAIDEDSGYLYRCGGSDNGLRIYDLSNPANPVFVGQWQDRYVHDAQIVTYDSGPYAGRQIAFCCAGLNGGFGATGLSIVDVTDKSNIFVRDHLQYSTAAYSHQGWLSEDRQYFYLNDELDEQDFGIPTTTRIIDVSNLDNAVEVGTFSSGSSSVDHNLYVNGTLIYEANYRSGLRVFDASNPLAPVEIAFFDTFPNSDSANFNGLWSSYPFFPSGTVIGSDLERGLFVWTIGPAALEFVYPDGRPEFLASSGATIRVEINDLSEALDADSPMLNYDAGTGLVSIPLVPVSPGVYDAVFPSLPCAVPVSYYISASSDAGTELTSPSSAPQTAFEAIVADDVSVAFTDDFESNLGWTVQNDGSLSDGAWERGVPVNCDRGDPPADADGSGQCYVTDNSAANGCNSDVDGGATTLVSPVLDASVDGAAVAYSRWFDNTAGSAPGEDVMTVEISDDGGSSWQLLETVGPTGPDAAGGWFQREFPLEFVPGLRAERPVPHPLHRLRPRLGFGGRGGDRRRGDPRPRL